MTRDQLEDLEQFVFDFRRNVRTFEALHRDNPYVRDMIEDMDTEVGMRMRCIRESVEEG